MCPRGEGFGRFVLKSIYMVKECALRDKSTKFGMVIVLTLLNKIGYGPRQIFC